MDGWVKYFCTTSNLTSSEVSIYGWNVRDLDHECMKSFLKKVTKNLTKLNAKSSSICIRFSMRSTYGFGRNLASLRSQAIDFEFLKDKVPKYFAERSKISFIISYLIRQLL
jgi:hypothetical protein